MVLLFAGTGGGVVGVLGLARLLLTPKKALETMAESSSAQARVTNPASMTIHQDTSR